ncbi:hypothetical protein E6H24_07715 [Candidatus Bathyarchaeota archaeon]|nr:MAG: hypothetical protein E6H24_07715 [Candidatus Bathyarchaeota archaeon]
MSQQEMQPATSRRFSLRSMLLLVLLVGFGAGATAYVLGSAFATTNGSATIGTSQQSTATTAGTTTTAHNCTLTSS